MKSALIWTEQMITLKTALDAARAEKRMVDAVRLSAKLEALIAATGYKPSRTRYCSRAGKRQADERRALSQRRR